jgi:hypothetical protein
VLSFLIQIKEKTRVVAVVLFYKTDLTIFRRRIIKNWIFFCCHHRTLFKLSIKNPTFQTKKKSLSLSVSLKKNDIKEQL